MEVIRDYKGRVVCMANASDGLIEIKYRDIMVRAIVDIGGTYTVEREGIITKVTRTSESHFSVSSYQQSA